MNKNKLFIRPAVSILSLAYVFLFPHNGKPIDDQCISYIVDTKQQDIKLYWKDDKQENFKSILNLKTWLAKNQKVLVFAMNGGMYKQGCKGRTKASYIYDGPQKHRLNIKRDVL